MKAKNRQSGQGTLGLVLIFTALVGLSLAAIVPEMRKAFGRARALKSKVETAQAIGQLSQLLRQSYDLGQYTPPCPGATYNQVSLGGINFCFPDDEDAYCVGGLICLAQPINITLVTHLNLPKEKEFAKPRYYSYQNRTFAWILPQAMATGTAIGDFLPEPSTSGVTLDIDGRNCAGSADPELCTRCSGADKNADCLRIGICLNGSTTCDSSNSDEYLDFYVGFKTSD